MPKKSTMVYKLVSSVGTGFFYSVPCVCSPGSYARVGGVAITPDVATAMEASRVALMAEAK